MYEFMKERNSCDQKVGCRKDGKKRREERQSWSGGAEERTPELGLEPGIFYTRTKPRRDRAETMWKHWNMEIASRCQLTDNPQNTRIRRRKLTSDRGWINECNFKGIINLREMDGSVLGRELQGYSPPKRRLPLLISQPPKRIIEHVRDVRRVREADRVEGAALRAFGVGREGGVSMRGMGGGCTKSRREGEEEERRGAGGKWLDARGLPSRAWKYPRERDDGYKASVARRALPIKHRIAMLRVLVAGTARALVSRNHSASPMPRTQTARPAARLRVLSHVRLSSRLLWLTTARTSPPISPARKFPLLETLRSSQLTLPHGRRTDFSSLLATSCLLDPSRNVEKSIIDIPRSPTVFEPISEVWGVRCKVEVGEFGWWWWWWWCRRSLN
ncbi:hypothetical protein B0H10DRAFT_2372466 [Mycena sp. CBHHK59/15]|nr:hypothetical protein B0H10DRAFT_2372466 [Mycena sp. CBHHK59/15]